MGLFDFLNKNKPVKSPAEDALLKAKEAFERKEFQETLRFLAPGFRKDVDYKPLYELAADALAGLKSEHEKELFEEVAKDMDSFEAFNRLGFHFSDIPYYELAQVFLNKANNLKPEDIETVHELAITYARTFQIAKAVKVLRSVEKDHDFWDMWFYLKCQILNKQPGESRSFLTEALISLKKNPPGDGLTSAILKTKELLLTLDRLEAIEIPENHIRDWHFIQYGAMILDFFEDSEEYVAGGRYVSLFGRCETIKTMAQRLKLALVATNAFPAKILAFPDRDSEIIGRVIALEFNLSFGIYNADSAPVDSLVVGAATNSFNQSPEFHEVNKLQTLFALNHNWLESALISPDILGLMSQHFNFPWNGGIRINPETNLAEKTPPDLRSCHYRKQQFQTSQPKLIIDLC